MVSGGPRNRSGPATNPKSGRSDRRGLVFKQLPAEGYTGNPPEFPLPKMVRTYVEVIDKVRTVKPDNSATISLRRREMKIWREVWALPQGKAWSAPRYQWLWPSIAEYCRLKALVEKAPDANATLVAQLHRYRDQIGLTNAGMRELGWDIADDEVADKRAEAAAETKDKPTSSARDRLKAARAGS